MEDPKTRAAGRSPATLAPVWLWLSVIDAVLAAVTSLLGILVPTTYSRETEAWAVQAIGQDYSNLAVVVLLLVSTWHLSRGSVRGYLVWLGAHVYLIYAFAIYAFAVHFQFLFLAYVAVLGLSFYCLLGGLWSVDLSLLAVVMPSGAKARRASLMLVAIGLVFALLWLSEIVPSLLAGSVPRVLTETGLMVNPVHVLDLSIVLPAMVVTGVLGWRQRAAGKVLSVPLLVFAVAMGLGIVVAFAIFASRGLPWSPPAAVFVGIIMLLGAWLATQYLMGVSPSRLPQARQD